MTDHERLRELQAARLREARQLRGFRSARSAQLRFRWSSAYPSHENGTRGIGRAYLEYAHKFQVNPAWLLGHSDERDLPATVAADVKEAGRLTDLAAAALNCLDNAAAHTALAELCVYLRRRDYDKGKGR